MRKNKQTHLMAGILIVFFAGVFLILTGRFMYIQATGEINDVSLEEWADQKRTTSHTLDSERGGIFDNNGMTLAYDRPTFRIYAVVDESYSNDLEEPVHVDDHQQAAQELAPILEMEESDILSRLQNGAENEQFQVEFGSAGNGLSQQERDDIVDLDLSGINFEKEAVRYYPNGVFASHIIGFARDSETETDDGEIIREISGEAGIENEMDDILSGQDGYISYQRDRFNNKLVDPNEVIQQPEDGNNVYLTIDQKIQTLLEDTLSQVEEDYNPESMTAVVMDPNTGEVIAMSNRPSYNPNDPSDVKNWYNDVISNPFEPGSTVKMFTWAAAIEEGVYNGDEEFSSGSYRANEQLDPIHDHNNGDGWGSISYDEGFIRSSNVATAKLLWEKMGAETYLEYIEAFDLDKETGIDLPGEVAGDVLYNWPLEKITTSFGQGSTMTPIQQMKAATAIANDGEMLQPYVIQSIVDSSTGDVIEEKSPHVVGDPISADTSEEVRRLLDAAVNSENATGAKYSLDDYTVGGKTGTAQIPGSDGTYQTGRENLAFSFLGMAPIDDPEMMMYVSVKQPELASTDVGSDPVAFIFNNVMENSLHYLNIEPDKGVDSSVEQVEIPGLVGKDSSNAEQTLIDLGLRVATIGSGEIVAANVEEGDEILPNDRVILVTDEPTMPDVTGWSLRDVMELANLLQLEVEAFGHGYVDTQSMEEDTPIDEGDYLGVELILPGENNTEEEITDHEESEQSDAPEDESLDTE
ncbi:penicillin-binding protein 2B [Virgibacillus natechei]|uniref:serine-type D-Ala-D-Ala carboxypeptidase n=1 Tax=Virgibacillus natechei TaxID=1216297 RepID=A0ABS4IDU5_9BACI|nr:penicillin-binding protein [Virgibacillus natechei]MBP1968199.1 penicillin-binding protein 2B [Virgibacillus natechei]UZD14529.1 penicillin-binding protein [Virgibacillus natechei]